MNETPVNDVVASFWDDDMAGWLKLAERVRRMLDAPSAHADEGTRHSASSLLEFLGKLDRISRENSCCVVTRVPF